LAYASRQSSYLFGSLGAVLQVLAGWWDVFSHILFGSVDPWWNPAHLTLYCGIAVTILAVWRGLSVPLSSRSVRFTPTRFVNVAGLKLAGLGCAIEVVAGIWNEIVHRVLRTEPRIAPAHGLLVVGMLTVSLGMVIGLTIEYGMIRQGFIFPSKFRRLATVAFIFLVFAAIWLAASGSFIYLGRIFRAGQMNWLVAALLALVAALVLVPAKRAMPGFGSGIAISIVFNIVSYVLLVFYAGADTYIPWGFFPFMIFELLVFALRRKIRFARTVVLSSLVTGVFFWATYYPFTLYLFPWSFSLQAPLFLVLLGSGIGASLGDRVYAGLSSVVLRDVAASL